MGCNSSTTNSVVPTQSIEIEEPIENNPKKDEKDDAHLMYSQLFKELLSEIKGNDRSKVISNCPDLYTEEDTYNLIATNPQLMNLTDYMREKIKDENPLVALGRLMLEMGSYNRAEYFYLQALPIEKNNSIRRAAILNNLGKIYHDQDKYDQALEYYEESVKIQRNYFPEDHSTFSTDYNNIGTIYQKQKKLDLALQYFQRALKIEMKASKPDEELIALFNNNIGLIYNDQEKFSQGLIYHEKCLKMNEKLLPSTHPSLALSHHNLAISLFSLARFNEALDHAQKAIQITSQSLPNGHPQRIAHQDLSNAIHQRMQ